MQFRAPHLADPRFLQTRPGQTDVQNYAETRHDMRSPQPSEPPQQPGFEPSSEVDALMGRARDPHVVF